jgi:hypothetical protein
MAGEEKKRRGGRWPTGAIVVAVALLLATLAFGVIGGGPSSTSTSTQSQDLGFPPAYTSELAPPPRPKRCPHARAASCHSATKR